MIVCHVQTQLWFIQLINYQEKETRFLLRNSTRENETREDDVEA